MLSIYWRRKIKISRQTYAYPHGVLLLVASNFCHQEKASSGDVFYLYWRGCRPKHRLSPFGFLQSLVLRWIQVTTASFRVILNPSFTNIVSFDTILLYLLTASLNTRWPHVSFVLGTTLVNMIKLCRRNKQRVCFPAFYTVNHFVWVIYCIQQYAQCLLSFSSECYF